MTDYEKELESIQIWVKAVANLPSYKLSHAKPKVARPVILWEMPSRGKDRNISRYVYVNKVRQFGKLFVNSLEEASRLQEKLITDLEERVGVLPIYDDGAVIAHLKAVVIEFKETDGLDIPFNISYEATYSRKRPEEAPPATYVGTRITSSIVPLVHVIEENLEAQATEEAQVEKEYNITGTKTSGQTVL